MRHLVALKTVAEEGTFAGAAARLGYTQSGLSQQIAALERIVGEVLLDRLPGRRPSGLTRSGQIVMRHGEAMLARLETMQADLAAAGNGTAGTLRVGIYQSVGSQILPSLLPRFIAAWPQVDVQLHESPADTELLSLLERGELDAAFCMLPLKEGPFAVIELVSDSYVLVLPRDSPLAAKRHHTAREIARLPLIGFRSCRHDHRIEAQLRARGLEPTVAFRSDDNATVQALVGTGMGAALMPRLTVDPHDSRTVCIDVGDLFPPRLLGIVWHADREPSAPLSAFLRTAQEVCAGAGNVRDRTVAPASA